MLLKKMAPPFIHSKAFIRTNHLTKDNLECMRVKNKKEAVDKLIANWTVGPVVMTFFHLSQDSRRVSKVEFVLFGNLLKDLPKIIATNKLFLGSGAKLIPSKLGNFPI